ncbi:MAG TPA: glucoamylase family protein, partial [Rhodothermia bacterium]
MRLPPWKCAFIALLTICSGLPSGSQAQYVLIFDDDDRTGSDYRDASFGFAESGDYLKLLGSSANKLPVEHDHSYAGQNSGLLEYRHGGGRWEMFAAAPEWVGQDLSQMDSLLMFLNGPAEIPAAELPRLGLEDTDNEKSSLISLRDYLPGLDSDSTTWQRAAIPLADFQPVGGYTASNTKTIRFVDSAVNPETRTLWFDLIVAISTATAHPDSPPRDLETRAGDRSVILRWDPPEGALGHHVYRTLSGGDVLDRITQSLISTSTFTDFDVENGTEYDYFVEPIGVAGQPGPLSAGVNALPNVMTDDEFLELVAHTAFDFFWYEANPENGLIKDRSTPTSNSSIASVGFGLTGIPIAIDNEWIDRDAGIERVITTLEFFWNSPHGPEADATGYRGFYYHFLNMQTGRRAGATELSTIDTALLLGGVLFVKEYFDGDSPDEVQIRALADSIFHRVDWPWASPRGPRVGHGWRPESGFIQFDWGGYNEAMILYILALGSPTHPIPESAWAAWTNGYDWETHYGYTFIGFPPLFGHQYTQVWVDFRGIQDAYTRARDIDYFENSRRATLANRAYCVANPLGWEGYGPNVWGLTASDGPTGYRARGAPPAQNDDGTIAPTAPGGSIVFTPEESIAALRHMYDTYRTQIWGPYGFRDAFNLQVDWFDTDYIGIDQGPILLMIE